jgi:hypothetical protein
MTTAPEECGMTAVEHRQQLSKDIGPHGGEENNNQPMKRLLWMALETAGNRQWWWRMSFDRM